MHIGKEPYTHKNLLTCYHDILACLSSEPQHRVTVMREALVQYEDLKIKSESLGEINHLYSGNRFQSC